MALTKPPKDYYSLTEIAEEWEWSVGDILEYGQQGKLEFCVRFVNKKVVKYTMYSGERHHSLRDFIQGICVRGDTLDCTRKKVDNRDELFEYLDGIYPVLQQQLDVELRYAKDQGEPFLVTDHLCQEFGVKDTGFWSIVYQLYDGNKLQLLITHKEKTRFEKEHEKPTEGFAQNTSYVSPREEEKPLRTIKAIADYCGVHADTVKDWRSNYKNFPASKPGEGTVTALPSELNAWMMVKK